METLGFAGFALGFMAVIWYLSRLMAVNGRNDQSNHGGNGSGF
jgi:hypothetical protein